MHEPASIENTDWAARTYFFLALLLKLPPPKPPTIELQNPGGWPNSIVVVAGSCLIVACSSSAPVADHYALCFVHRIVSSSSKKQGLSWVKSWSKPARRHQRS